MKIQTFLKRCVAAVRLQEIERIDSGRARFEWQFSPLEPRHMFDGEGLIADPGAPVGDVPALFADMTHPADAPSAPQPQINNVNTGAVTSDGDETLAQSFHAVEIVPPGPNEFSITLPVDGGGRLQVRFLDPNAGTSLQLRSGSAAGVLLTTSAGDNTNTASIDLHLSSGEYHLQVESPGTEASLEFIFSPAAAPIAIDEVTGRAIPAGIKVDGEPLTIIQSSIYFGTAAGHGLLNEFTALTVDPNTGSGQAVVFTALDDGSLVVLSLLDIDDTLGTPIDIRSINTDGVQGDELLVLHQQGVTLWDLNQPAGPLLEIANPTSAPLRDFDVGDIDANGQLDLVVGSADEVKLIRSFAVDAQRTTMSVIEDLGFTTEHTGLAAIAISDQSIFVSTYVLNPNSQGTSDTFVETLRRWDWLGAQLSAPLYTEFGREYAPYLDPARYSHLEVVQLVTADATTYVSTGYVVYRSLPNQLELIYEDAADGELVDMDNDGILDRVSNQLSVATGRVDENGVFRNFFNGFSAESLPAEIRSLELGDVNQDGRSDAILGLFNSGTGQYEIASYLATTLGSFQYEQVANRLTSPAYAVAGDFNRDGRLDVLSLSVGGARSLLYGAGDGAFVNAMQPGGFPGASGFNSNLITQDFNGDGRLDLAVLQGTPTPVLRVYLGLGDGRFLPSPIEMSFATSHIPTRTQHSLIAEDLNGDGLTDFAVLSRDENFKLFVNIFDGISLLSPTANQLTPVTSFAAGLGEARGDDGIYKLVAGQFVIGNSPGIDLLVLTERENSTPEALLLRNQGSFQFSLSTATAPAINGRFADIEAVDLNGDLVDDLVVATRTDAMVWKANGDGSFVAQPNLFSRPSFAGEDLVDILIADLDQDVTNNLSPVSPPEIIIADRTSERLRVFANDGLSFDFVELSTTNDYLLPPDSNFSLAIAGQFDQQAGNDVLLIDTVTGETLLYRGGVQSQAVVGQKDLRVESTDIDGNGVEDFVTLDEAGRLRLRMGSIDSSIPATPRVVFGSPITIGIGVRDVQIRQLPSGPAILASMVGNGQAMRLVSMEWSDADQNLVTQELYASTTPFAFGVGELNAVQGDEVAVIERAEDPRLFVLSGVAIVDTVDVELPGQASQVLIVDQNIFVTDSSSSLVSVFDPVGNLVSRFRADNEAITDGMAAAGQALTSLSGSQQFVLADLNGDLIDDIVVMNSGNHSLSILWGTGQGFTRPIQTINLDHPVVAIATSDVNGDGAADVVVLQNDEHDFLTNGPSPSEVTYTIRKTDGTTITGTATMDYLDQLVDLQGMVDFSTFAFVNQDAGQPFQQTVSGEGAWIFDPVSGRLNFTPDANFVIGRPIRDEAILVLFGAGDGQFDVAHRAASFDAPSNLTALKLIDYNSDGLLDLMMTNSFGDLISFQGTGNPGIPFELVTEEFAKRNEINLDLLTVDGVTTAVTSRMGDENRIVVHEWMDPQFDDTLEPTKAYEDRTPSSVHLQRLLVNGTLFEFPSLIYLNESGNNLVVRRGLAAGDGSLVFDPIISYAVGTNPTDFAIQDINGDGYSDIVVANQGSGDLSVLLGAPQGDYINFNTVAQRLSLENVVAASGNSFVGDIRPVSVAFSDSTTNADIIVAVQDTAGNSGFATLSNAGNGLFSDQLGGITVSPATNGAIINAAFVGNQGIALLNNGNVIRFDPSAPQRNPFVGAFGNATLVKPLFFEEQLIIGVANDTGIQFIAADRGNQVAAVIDFGDTQDFVFEEARNLLFLANSNEFVTVRELTFVISQFGDLSGIFAQRGLTSGGSLGGQLSLGAGTSSVTAGQTLVGTVADNETADSISDLTLRAVLEQLVTDFQQFLETTIEQLQVWGQVLAQADENWMSDVSIGVSRPLFSATWQVVNRSILGDSSPLNSDALGGFELLWQAWQIHLEETSHQDSTAEYWWSDWQLAVDQLLDTPVDDLRALLEDQLRMNSQLDFAPDLSEAVGASVIESEADFRVTPILDRTEEQE